MSTMKLKDTRKNARPVEADYDEPENVKKQNVTFASILGEVQKSKDVVTIGDFEFTELSTAQQRKILNSGFAPVEMFTVLDNIFNNYIHENVRSMTEMESALGQVTLETKPFFLNVLRKISLGDTYYDSDTKKSYKLPEVTADDLVTHTKPIEITVGDDGGVVITVAVPNLRVDGYYNDLLKLALKPYKKKSLEDSDVASPVYDLLGQYEVMKYIDTVSFRGTSYEFVKIPMEQKKQFLDNLPSKKMEEIKNFILGVKEISNKATLYHDDETGEEVQGYTYNLFLIKSVLPTTDGDE